MAPRLAGEKAALWALVAFSFLLRAVFVYRAGTPEPDSMMIAAGVALGANGDVPFRDTLLYGPQLNPGVYILMRAAYPLLWTSPSAVVTILNWVAVITGALTLWPMFDLFRRWMTARVALTCVGVWAFTPLVWEAHTYFHPLIPATFLLLLAMSRAARDDGAGKPWRRFAVAAALATAAVVIRGDVVLGLAGVALFVVSAKNRGRNVVKFAVAGVIVVVVYAAVLAFIGDAGRGAGPGQFLSRWTHMYTMSSSFAGLPRSLAWAAMGLGLVSAGWVVFALFASLGGARRHKTGWRVVIAALFWALPVLVFWLPYLVPILRHYYLASIGLALLVGVLVLANTRPERVVLVGAIIVACNLLVPEALYRGYNATAATPKVPHGAFFYGHATAATEVAQLAALREAVVNDAGESGAIVLCRWNVFTNVTYEIVSRGVSALPAEVRGLYPEARYFRYTTPGRQIRLINYVYFEDPEMRAGVSQLLESSRREGYHVYIPDVVVDRLIDVDTSGVIIY